MVRSKNNPDVSTFDPNVIGMNPVPAVPDFNSVVMPVSERLEVPAVPVVPESPIAPAVPEPVQAKTLFETLADLLSQKAEIEKKIAVVQRDIANENANRPKFTAAEVTAKYLARQRELLQKRGSNPNLKFFVENKAALKSILGA